MDLSQLEIFRAVAEHGSIQAAAQHLHRVPSNLTTRIKQLEQELGVELFIRERMRLRLSATGISFLDYARRILDLAEQAKRSVSGAEPMGALPLGALESTATVRIPPILTRFHQRYPKVGLRLATGPSGDMLDAVIAGQLAAAFVDGPINHPHLEGQPVFEEDLMVISALNHPPITRAQDVNGEDIYAFRANCSYRRLFENWFAADQAAPGAIHEIESYPGMVACVCAGAGLALIPQSLLASLPSHDSVAAHTPFEGFRRVPTWLVWRRGAQTPALKALVDMISEPT